MCFTYVVVHTCLDSHITTIGVDFKLRTIQVGDTRVKLQVWDTGTMMKIIKFQKPILRKASPINPCLGCLGCLGLSNIR